MTDVAGRTVLITGAAGELGSRLAVRFAAHGARIVLWDVDEAALAPVSAGLPRPAGAPPHHHQVVDLCDRQAIEAATQATLAVVGQVDVLVNNAGVTTGERFVELSDEAVERTMQINATAPMLVTRRLLPSMIERNHGHVVTVASAAGLTGAARLVAYCASKHAAVGFNEALRQELRAAAPGVRTTLVCPFFMTTRMFAGVHSKRPWLLPIMHPDDVADRIVAAVRRDRLRVLLPWFVRLAPALRALPLPVVDWLSDVLGLNESMETFVGHRPSAAGSGGPASDRRT